MSDLLTVCTPLGGFMARQLNRSTSVVVAGGSNPVKGKRIETDTQKEAPKHLDSTHVHTHHKAKSIPTRIDTSYTQRKASQWVFLRRGIPYRQVFRLLGSSHTPYRHTISVELTSRHTQTRTKAPTHTRTHTHKHTHRHRQTHTYSL